MTSAQRKIEAPLSLSDEEPATIHSSAALVIETATRRTDEVSSSSRSAEVTPIHRVLAPGNNPNAEPDVEVESPALPSSWLSAAKSRRDVPKAAKIAAGGVLALLVGVFALPGACGSRSTKKSTMIVDTTIAASDSLHKRRHLTDDDFRSNSHRHVAPAPAVAAEPGAPTLSIEERQRLREQNPEDLRGAQARRRNAPKRRSGVRQISATSKDDWQEEDMIDFFEPEAQISAPGSKRGAKRAVLVPAATSIDVSLTRDLIVRGRGTTVVALVGRDQLLPAGTKILGTATADRDGLVTIRFRSIASLDGASIRVRAEAIDPASGSPSLVGSVSGGVREDSVSDSVGRDAAQRGIMAVVGRGFIGETVSEASSQSNRSRRSARRSPLVVTISRSTPVTALFLVDVTE